MIRLTLMNDFFERVDDKGWSPIVDRIAARWFNAGTATHVGGASSNFAARVPVNGRTLYLRFNHESERTAAYYGAEVAFIEHLLGRGMRVARPVPSRAGALVESVPTDMGVFHATLFEAVPGSERDLADLDEPALRVWGRMMGAMHVAAEDFGGEGRPTWRDHLAFAGMIVPEVEKVALAELNYVERALGDRPSDASRFGLIHFDLEPDNMRWLDGAPGVFDFDDCAHYWFVADVAYALRDLFEDRIDRIDLADRRLRTFVDGYRTVRPLPEDELRLLPLLVRAHNLYWFARLLRALGTGPVDADPQWTRDLRARLRTVTDGYRVGFKEHPARGYVG